MALQGTVIRSIFQTATSLGAAFDQLCEMSDIGASDISDSESMVEWEKAALIWVPLLKLSGDSLIGLHIGMEVKNMLNGMVGFLIQSCRDIDQGLEVLCRYGQMVSPMVSYRYTCDDDPVLEMEQNNMWVKKYPEPARHANDFLIAATVNTLRELTGKHIVPSRIELAYSTRQISEYQKFFGCDVYFDKNHNRIFLNKEDIATPLLTNDRSMFQMFNSIVAEKHALSLMNSTAANLKHLLFMQFKGRIASIDEAASALMMTSRTLQRRLMLERTTFLEIAAEVRKEIAFQLMRNPTISISEVSDILGYSDPSAFRKAFKSWTKAAPKAIRKKRL